MIRYLIAVVFVSLLTLGGYLYYYLGFYKPIEILEAERGPFHFLYQEHAGAYHEIGPTIAAVEKWALANNIYCAMTFGEYLDDPSAVDQDRLRSHGGCVLNARPEKIPDDMKYEEREALKYVIGRFEGSPSIGPFKVYPKIKKHIEERRLKTSTSSLELYRVSGKQVTTEILFKIEN
jgi:AraC family transcriptional regulator